MFDNVIKFDICELNDFYFQLLIHCGRHFYVNISKVLKHHIIKVTKCISENWTLHRRKIISVISST